MPTRDTKILILSLLLWTATATADDIAFVNVNVIPMTSNTVQTAKTVIISNGIIETIGGINDTPIPEGATVIDGTDRFLMPGLSEMHAHIPNAGSDSLTRVLNLYIANGITLMRGMLGQASHLTLRQQILDGDVLAPRLLTSGPSFNGRSVSGASQAASMVRQQHADGYDFLKVHPGLTKQEFDSIAGTARELGIPFAGHVPADVGLRRALDAGIATIDHLDGYMQELMPAHEDPAGGFEGFFGLLLAEYADPAKIAAIVEDTRTSGTWNVPTQSLFEHAVSGDSADDMSAWPEMRYMPRRTVQQWSDYKQRIVTDENYRLATADHAIELRRQIIKMLHDSGAGLLLGSDSPQVFNVPGFAIHRELQYLVDAGLTPYQALVTGTVNPARFFGRAEFSGTVEVGREADLVLLDANPLEDISASRRVHGVMLRGRWVANAEIRRMLQSMAR